MKGKFFAGTSGYSYKHWGKGVFYPGKLTQRKWLEYYCNIFTTVELNVTFYRLPEKNIFEGWYKRTPEGFSFAVKGSRFITHVKKLSDCHEPLQLFLSHAEALRDKLSVVLWQLPAGFHADKEKLETFCKNLKGLTTCRQVFEFRHNSWFVENIYTLLADYNIALCIAHSSRWPSQEVITADFVYLRFHGGSELYHFNYSEEELMEWADKIKKWLSNGKNVYTYFNNDAYGYAVKNALRLREMVTNK